MGSPISLKGTGASGAAFGGTKVENAQLLLGGPLTEMASASGPSALLELCMLPPMGLPDRDDTVQTHTYTRICARALSLTHTVCHRQRTYDLFPSTHKF